MSFYYYYFVQFIFIVIIVISAFSYIYNAYYIFRFVNYGQQANYFLKSIKV